MLESEDSTFGTNAEHEMLIKCGVGKPFQIIKINETTTVPFAWVPVKSMNYSLPTLPVS